MFKARTLEKLMRKTNGDISVYIRGGAYLSSVRFHKRKGGLFFFKSGNCYRVIRAKDITGFSLYMEQKEQP